MRSSSKAIFFDAFTQSLTFLKNSRMMECVGLVAFKIKVWAARCRCVVRVCVCVLVVYMDAKNSATVCKVGETLFCSA